LVPYNLTSILNYRYIPIALLIYICNTSMTII